MLPLTSVTYASRLETIVLSHFLLDLRHTALRPIINGSAHDNSFSETLNTASLPSELRFNSHVLRDLGGSLSIGSDDDVEDELSEQIGEDIDRPESS